MTNFIYNMQDELSDLNMALSPMEWSTMKKLIDHIGNQAKQLRDFNKAIEKKNATIAKYEKEKEDLQTSNCYLINKVNELNNGIRNSEDLSWKQKYDALVISSEQAISALQKKCQEYKHSEDTATISAIETLSEANKKLVESNERLKEKYEDIEKNKDELIAERDALYKENNELKEEVNIWGNTAEIIAAKTVRIKELEEKNKVIEKRCREAEKELETDKKIIAAFEETLDTRNKALGKEQQVSKDLNVIINNKNKLLDEHMTKYNNLEHNYKEEVKMKELFKATCFRHERTIESQNSIIKYLKSHIPYYIRLDDDIMKLKYDNDTLREKVKEIRDLAETIVELCEDEE